MQVPETTLINLTLTTPVLMLERSKFIEFVWGRSRLPRDGEFPTTFKIDKRAGGEVSLSLLLLECVQQVTCLAQAGLPYTHTCFFSIELPPYADDETMKKRLLAAIHYGLGAMLNG